MVVWWNDNGDAAKWELQTQRIANQEPIDHWLTRSMEVIDSTSNLTHGGRRRQRADWSRSSERNATRESKTREQ